MAYSQPLSASVRQKGQTVILCQLCEIDPKLKWKCLECGLLMCQRCRDKVHPKFPSAEDHTIIDIKDISKHQTDPEPKPDFTKLKCDVHSGKFCCLFCKTCQNLVCQTCVAKTHNTHNFGEIDEEYQTKLEIVKTRENEIKVRLQNLTKTEQKLKQIKINEQSNYDKVKQEILDYEEALVNEIKEHIDKCRQELDQKQDAVLNRIRDEEKKLELKQRQIQHQSQKLHQLFQTDNVKNVFSYSDSWFKSVETDVTLLHNSFNGIPKFTPGDKTKIPLILGELEDVIIQYNTELQVNKMFDTDLKKNSGVVSCPDGSLWISDTSSSILQRVKPKMEKLSVTTNLKIQVGDAALLPSGDLLLSVAGSSSLKLIKSGSTDIHDSVYTVSPLMPTTVHVTCDNKVIVGVNNDYTIPATGPRQVIVMDQTGRHEKVFRYDRYNKTLFTYPFSVTSNSKRTIAVTDIVSKYERGRVVVLDLEGGRKNIYTGHSDVNNKNNPLMARSITTTPSDNFVVADPPNHTLHVLNSEGEIITFYNTNNIGILLPQSVSFTTTGQLCIGCGAYTDSKENAKLFIVDNFRF